MARPEKVATVEEIRNKLESARAAVLTEYRGLKVGELAALRASLRAADAEYKIFKNTLARRAAEEAGLAELATLLDGPVAITFVRGDAVMVAKALRDYARAHPALVVKGGILGTRVIRSDDVVALADIQPREVLLARVAGGLQSPLAKAAGLFSAFTRNMAYGIKGLIDQRVAAGESAAEPEPPATEPEPPAAEPEPPAAAEPEPPTAEPEPPTAEPEPPAAEAPEPPAAEAPAAEPEPPAEVATAEAPAPEAAEAPSEVLADALAEPEPPAEIIEEAPTAAAVDGPPPAETPTEPPPAEPPATEPAPPDQTEKPSE